MICFKCDRCGEVFDWYKENGYNGFARIKTEKDGANLTSGGEINLCPACMKTLNDWMAGNARLVSKSEEENLVTGGFADEAMFALQYKAAKAIEEKINGKV